MKSFMANPSNIEHKWYVVDAADKTLAAWLQRLQKSCAVNTNRPLPRTWTPVIT